MFILNLKIAWRNLLKQRSYALINIFGLALGLAGFILMLLFINREKSYDTWNPELKNVYQVQEYSDFFSVDKKAHWISAPDYRLSGLFSNQIPEVKAVTAINLYYRDKGVTIKGKPAFLQSGIRRSDSLFFKVMPYQFKYGNSETALQKPYSMVLKEHLAKKYFGDINPVGKEITISDASWDEGEIYTVTGVINEPSTPTSVNFEAIVFEDSHYFDVNRSIGTESELYVRMDNVGNLERLNEKIQAAYLPLKDQFLKQNKQSVAEKTAAGMAPVLKITQLTDVHQEPLLGKSWKENMRPVMLLCTLLLCVSIINFINLATAQAAGRAKEVGIKKVVGAYRKSLISQFLIEAFILTLIATALGLLLVEISLPLINRALAVDLSLFNGDVVMFLSELLGIVFVVGFAVGVYPAVFLSSYQPGKVLKGNFAQGKGSAMLRKALVGVQFVISAGFIIAILVVNTQLNFLKARDKGFTPTGLITMKYGGGGDDYPEIQALRRIDGIKYVSFSSGVIGDYRSTTSPYKFDGETKDLYDWGMGIDGMQALDARLIAGRLFSRTAVQDTVSSVIINESAARLFKENMLGKTLKNAKDMPVTVIGVIKDIQVEGFENAAKPTIYAVYKDNGARVGYTVKPTTLIRYELAKKQQVVKDIEAYFATQNAAYPVSYTYTEEALSAVMIDHERFEKMVALFSSLSLALSLFGLFALAAFITRQRTKEIAVRKVLGAENTDILILLNKGYIWILLAANAIAFPLTYILVNKWLSSFAYRVEISPLPFVIAFMASILVTLLTVSMQARKAIKANPVNALKYE